MVRYLCPFFEHILRANGRAYQTFNIFFVFLKNFRKSNYTAQESEKLETFEHFQSILHAPANIHLK